MKTTIKTMALACLMTLSMAFTAKADKSKLPTTKSNVRKEILKHIEIPSWMTRNMEQESVSVIFTTTCEGKAEIKSITGDNEKLVEHVRNEFSKMKLDSAVMLNDTEYRLMLTFDVR
jgi:hypothetical protein